MLCSGKLAYELMEARDEAGDLGVEIVRIEQLYPFPSEPLVKRLNAMPNLQELIWAQEEPKNNGAWFFVEDLLEQCLTDCGHKGMRAQYAGRDASASPATGLAKRHAAEQAAVIAAALGHSSPGSDARLPRRTIRDKMATDVQVPTLGESITEGTLAQWLKKPGDAVAEDEPIASLETDKVSVEVPSPVAGVLAEQLVKEGDNVAVGAVIARVDQGASAAPSPAKAAADATTNPAGAGETRLAARATSSPQPTCGSKAGPMTTDTSRRCRPRCGARCSNIMSIRPASGAPARTGG